MTSNIMRHDEMVRVERLESVLERPLNSHDFVVCLTI